MCTNLDNFNYARDSRNQGPASVPDGLPTHWVVCPVCNGEGSHVNPAIDSGGISAERFAEDPDFAESYFSGVYDVKCGHCEGRSTVREVDESRMTEAERADYREEIESEAQYRAENLAEIRAGA